MPQEFRKRRWRHVPVEEGSMYLLALCIEIPSYVYRLKKHVVLPLVPVPSVPEKEGRMSHNNRRRKTPHVAMEDRGGGWSEGRTEPVLPPVGVARSVSPFCSSHPQKQRSRWRLA